MRINATHRKKQLKNWRKEKNFEKGQKENNGDEDDDDEGEEDQTEKVVLWFA